MQYGVDEYTPEERAHYEASRERDRARNAAAQAALLPIIERLPQGLRMAVRGSVWVVQQTDGYRDDIIGIYNTAADAVLSCEEAYNIDIHLGKAHRISVRDCDNDCDYKIWRHSVGTRIQPV
jgi:hypothetical protein